jgi:hypothetical protein
VPRVVKSFNTLTAAFQQEAAGRTGEKRVAMFLAGDDAEAKRVVAGLIDDAGFDPVELAPPRSRRSSRRREGRGRCTARSTARPRRSPQWRRRRRDGRFLPRPSTAERGDSGARHEPPIHSPTMPTSATRTRLSAAPRRAVLAVGIIAITA